MPPGPRSYGSGVEKALYRLARGTCYFPDCPRRIIEAVEGEPVVAVDIAHIRGAKPGSARYDPSMTDEERAAFPNLILLCSPHHKLVDRIRPEDFPPGMLEEWKRANEPADGIEALASSGLTDEILDEVIEQVVARVGLRREVEVDLTTGLLMSPVELVSLGNMDVLRSVLELNPNMVVQPRLLLVNIRNTGTVPASVEGVELLEVIGDEADHTTFGLMGRNDFGASNPQLPYRLLDGDAVRWLTKIETIEAQVKMAESNGLTVTGVRARVRLGTGETVESAFMPWVDLS
ncbi:hypothetical protein [Kribbella sp. NPDC023855]|uniref:hypothetical protein n=1 Tax=Kribbella sp. NPDC023855 TaxID=3154698 RepID=UPI0033E54A1C